MADTHLLSSILGQHSYAANFGARLDAWNVLGKYPGFGVPAFGWRARRRLQAQARRLEQGPQGFARKRGSLKKIQGM